MIPTIPYIFEKSPTKITTDLLVSSKDKIPEDAYFISIDASIIRSTIKRNVVDLYTFRNQNEYFKDKELFLLKDIWWWDQRKYRIRQPLREFVYKNYDLEPMETAEFNNVYEFGVYRLVKK